MYAGNHLMIFVHRPTNHNCNNDKLFTDIDYQHADGKKSCWVPDKSTGGYLEGLCENDMKVAKKNEKTEKMKMLKEISLLIVIGGQD